MQCSWALAVPPEVLGGSPGSGRSSARPFCKTALQEDWAGWGHGQRLFLEHLSLQLQDLGGAGTGSAEPLYCSAWGSGLHLCPAELFLCLSWCPLCIGPQGDPFFFKTCQHGPRPAALRAGGAHLLPREGGGRCDGVVVLLPWKNEAFEDQSATLRPCSGSAGGKSDRTPHSCVVARKCIKKTTVLFKLWPVMFSADVFVCRNKS